MRPEPYLDLKHRSSLGLLSVLLVNIGMLVADVGAGVLGSASAAPTIELGLFRLVILAIGLVVLGASSRNSVLSVTMLAALVFNTIVAVWMGHWRGQPDSAVVAAVAVGLGAAVLLPWGVVFQSVLVLGLLLTLLGGELLFAGQSFSFFLMLLGTGSLAVTVLLARETAATQHRLTLGASQRAASRREAAVLRDQLEEQVLERTVDLRVAAQELEQLCQAASHDLRPPLRTIAGFSEILRESALRGGATTSVGPLDSLIEVAQSMGTRIDDLLAGVRRTHRVIVEGTLSLSDVAHSERLRLSQVAPSCRWSIEDEVEATTSSLAVAGFLRALLRFAVWPGDAPGAREVSFGVGETLEGRAFCLRACGGSVDAEQRRVLALALAGGLPSARIPAELNDVVGAARVLISKHGGQVRVASDEELTVWFRGAEDDTAPEDH